MQRVGKHWYYLLTVVLTVVILRSAWVCDDAYISFRTVDNFVNGFGLTWNVAERVQAFTNPLWVFLMSAVYFFTGEAYYSSIFLSVILTLGAAYLVVRRIAVNMQAAFLGMALLICSKAFIDYSTSGLENALSYFLLALFCAIYFRTSTGRSQLFFLSLIASLCLVNRLDTILLVAPVLAAEWWRGDKIKGFKQIIVGMVPFILWELFSLIYYGFPLPNTFYAKLTAGIPTSEMIVQGFIYYLDSLNIDPVTLAMIAFGILVGLFSKSRRSLLIAIGIVLYLVYVIRVGGDFMSGRFFAITYMLAIILICRIDFKRWGEVALAALIAVGLSVTSERSPLLATGSYGDKDKLTNARSGVVDERGYYYQATGLLGDSRDRSMPDHWWYGKGRHLKDNEVDVTNDLTIGFMSYAAGTSVHIIDQFALSDPLLARLPAAYPDDWLTGHIQRAIPRGYFVSCRTGTNAILDPNLKSFYEHLRLITRGSVWSWDRLGKIIRMNLGQYSDLLDNYALSKDNLFRYVLVSEPKAQGTDWNHEGCLVIYEEGITIEMDSAVSCAEVELSVDHNDSYELHFMLEAKEISVVNIPIKLIPEHGLRVDTIQVTSNGSPLRYDAVRIMAVNGDGRYSLGHFRLLCD